MGADSYFTHLQTCRKDPFALIKSIKEARGKALMTEKTLHSQVKMMRDQLKNSHEVINTASGG